MKKLNLDDVRNYVSQNIGSFHTARLDSLARLELRRILLRKNPYLFKAKNILTSEAFVKYLLDAHLSSQEETIFGGFLEGLAIFINGKVYGGAKSAAEGIDLEFVKNDIKYIVAIKSGPNWGNSSQIRKMKDNFRTAKRVLGTNASKVNIVAVNGCCYGRDNNPDKTDYLKYCGQTFWEFVSGNPNLYTEIIEPLGYQAREKNEEFQLQYATLINRLTGEFSAEFCPGGVIDWKKLVEMNSKKN